MRQAPDTQAPTSWRVLVHLPLVVFAGLGILHTWSIGERGAGVDFYQFWAVGQAVNESLVEDIYDPKAGLFMGQAFLRRAQETKSPRLQAAARFRSRDKIEVASTPFLYTVFYLIQSGDFERDINLFRLLGLICTVLSIVAIGRMEGYPLAWILVVLAFIFWSFSPLHDDIRDGNVNQIQLGVVVLYLWLARGAPEPRGRVSWPVPYWGWRSPLSRTSAPLPSFWGSPGSFAGRPRNCYSKDWGWPREAC